jgi:chorismate mutase
MGARRGVRSGRRRGHGRESAHASEALRAKPVACTVQLALAGGSVTVGERLDTLHRQALATATHHVCVTGRATVS